MDPRESALPVRVWIEVHCIGAKPATRDNWCQDCALPSVYDVYYAYVNQRTLAVVGHALYRWCPDCGRCEPVKVGPS